MVSSARTQILRPLPQDLVGDGRRNDDVRARELRRSRRLARQENERRSVTAGRSAKAQFAPQSSKSTTYASDLVRASSRRKRVRLKRPPERPSPRYLPAFVPEDGCGHAEFSAELVRRAAESREDSRETGA